MFIVISHFLNIRGASFVVTAIGDYKIDSNVFHYTKIILMAIFKNAVSAKL